jgi:hypothetical protein
LDEKDMPARVDDFLGAVCLFPTMLRARRKITFTLWRERPFGLRPAGPLALLLAPYMQPGMLVARAWPAGLGPAAKCKCYFAGGP